MLYVNLLSLHNHRCAKAEFHQQPAGLFHEIVFGLFGVRLLNQNNGASCGVAVVALMHIVPFVSQVRSHLSCA